MFRTSGSIDAATLADVRAIGAALNSALPVGNVVAMVDSIARARAQWDVLARLMFVPAGLADLLAAVGLYGVVAFGVESRRREFGIRIALGATPRRVVHHVLRRTGLITTAGLVLGAAGAIALGQLLKSRLVGVQPFDPIVWILACAGLVAIAAVASFVPARRAMRVEAGETLRAL